MMLATSFEPEAVREKALQTLREQDRPMCTGDLAMLLREPAHRIVIAMDGALQDSKVTYHNGTWILCA